MKEAKTYGRKKLFTLSAAALALPAPPRRPEPP
jgi:hypothetical protein